jgi:hypothetical protein
MNMAMLLLLFALSFLLRFIFVFSEGTDTMMHLWQIKKQKLNKNFSHEPFNSIIKGKQATPSLAHYIISIFPEKFYKPAGLLLNIGYDLVTVLIIFLFCRFYLMDQLPSSDSAFFIPFEYAVAFVFSTSPILFPVDARLRSLGARTFGLVLTTLFFVLVGWAQVESIYYPYILSVILVVLITMSSQFAMQVMVLFSLFYSLISFEFLPLITVIAGFGLGYILPFTGIKHFTKYKINHYIWYFRNYKKGTTAANRNNLREFIKLPYYLIHKPFRFFKILLVENSFVIACYSMPMLLYILISLLNGNIDYTLYFENEWLKFMTYLFLASLMAFLLTSFRPFLFLGSPERYLEYGVGFLSILFAYTLLQPSIRHQDSLFLIVLLIHMVFIVMNLLYLLYNRTNACNIFKNDNLKDLSDYLNNKIGQANILTLPTKLSYGIAFARPNQHIRFYYPFISGKLDGFKYMEQEEVLLYLVKPDFQYFKATYGIDHLIVEHAVLKETPLAADYKEQLNSARCLFSTQEYSIYKI